MVVKHAFLKILSYKCTNICLLSNGIAVQLLKFVWKKYFKSYGQNCVKTSTAPKYTIHKILS